MRTNRRDFLKVAGMTGTGMITGGLASCANSKSSSIKDFSPKSRKQYFNMSGFAAPKLDVVRVGYIGIGGRGLGSVRRMRLIEGVEIRALCDILEDRVNMGQEALKQMGMPPARSYSGSEVIWKEISPWQPGA